MTQSEVSSNPFLQQDNIDAQFKLFISLHIYVTAIKQLGAPLSQDTAYRQNGISNFDATLVIEMKENLTTVPRTHSFIEQ